MEPKPRPIFRTDLDLPAPKRVSTNRVVMPPKEDEFTGELDAFGRTITAKDITAGSITAASVGTHSNGGAMDISTEAANPVNWANPYWLRVKVTGPILHSSETTRCRSLLRAFNNYAVAHVSDMSPVVYQAHRLVSTNSAVFTFRGVGFYIDHEMKDGEVFYAPMDSGTHERIHMTADTMERLCQI